MRIKKHSFTGIVIRFAIITFITCSCTMDEIHEFQDLGRKVNEKKANVDSTLEKVTEGLTKMDEYLQSDRRETLQDSVVQKNKTPEIDSSGL